MRKLGLFVSAAGLLLVASQAPAQDIVEGTIFTYDSKANVLVLTDKTVWPLEKLVVPAPASMKAGDRIQLQYDSNEDDGVTAIHGITMIK